MCEVRACTSQCDCAVLREGVWVEEHRGLSVQALLHVHHTLVLQTSVVEVEVPAAKHTSIVINPRALLGSFMPTFFLKIYFQFYSRIRPDLVHS